MDNFLFLLPIGLLVFFWLKKKNDEKEMENYIAERNRKDQENADYFKKSGVKYDPFTGTLKSVHDTNPDMLLIEYISKDSDETTRMISDIQFTPPLQIKAYCHLRDEKRTFRIDKIKSCINVDTGLEVGNVFDYFESNYSKNIPKKESNNMSKVATYLPKEFVVFDLETTGLSAVQDEIIEIGAIKATMGGDEQTTFQVLIKPKRKVSKTITDITGITQDMLDLEGCNSDQAIKNFIEFIGDLPLVAYNADFDMRFLFRAAEENGLAVNNQVFCALKTTKKAFVGFENYKLSTVAQIAGLSTEGVHRSLKDCELTLKVHILSVKKLMER